MRELPFRGEVQRAFLTPEQYRTRLTAELNKADSLESIEYSRLSMVALGLLAPDVDLYRLELEFRSSVVLGQYDPETQELYVITSSDPTGPLERVTLAHEYAHSLQDQHYNIRSLMPKDSDNSDRDLAISALLEGDALITEELYQTLAMTRSERDEKRRQERALGSTLDLAQLPKVLLDETYFPYGQGPRFIAAVVGPTGAAPGHAGWHWLWRSSQCHLRQSASVVRADSLPGKSTCVASIPSQSASPIWLRRLALAGPSYAKTYWGKSTTAS